MRRILIGGAWPYANGSLHLGHIAGLLPGDVIARYHRAVGDRVYFVSGSDCHGTPVAIRAKQENRTPQEISDRYHEEFTKCFRELGFSYDVYTKTSSEQHKEFVKAFHRKLYKSPYVCEKKVPQAYCETCRTFLADRFVTGKCPECGRDTRGDQCDFCGTVLEPESLKEPVCAVCGSRITFREANHLYIRLSALQEKLAAFIGEHPNWRKNAIAFSKRYLNEGLRDRALTRDLDWGIEVPKKGFEDKKIYIWAENVLGYLSASRLAVERQTGNAEDQENAAGKRDAEDRENAAGKGNAEDQENAADREYAALWGSEAKHYYVHGKDNIPFHTIILPGLLIANGEGWHLPDEIISSEYLTLEGRKISTSQNYAIWVKDLLGRYDADSIRYYLLANGPEKKDADFSWKEYINSHNGELLGAYGNFVNRTLVFIAKYLNNRVPEGTKNKELSEQTEALFTVTGKRIEAGNLREALGGIFDLVHTSNRYYDIEQPWITRTTEPEACNNTIYNCVQLTACLAVLLAPFLPFSSEKVCRLLSLDTGWIPKNVPAGYELPEIPLLFQRIDKKTAEEETARLAKL